MPPRHDRLESPRLVLRRWQASDAAPFAAMNADPAVMRHFPAPLTGAETAALIARFERDFDDRGFGLYALQRKDDGRFIGFTGLSPSPADLPCSGLLEVGWRLDPSAWHRGFATEAARACLDLAFGPLGQRAVCSFTAIANVASVAVMRRLGMREWLRFEHPRIEVNSPVREHVAYLIDLADWVPTSPLQAHPPG